MAKKFYKVSEKELKVFINCKNRLEALECGGVDNWEYYGESIHEYVKDYKEENNIPKEEEFYLYDITDEEIKNYEEIK